MALAEFLKHRVSDKNSIAILPFTDLSPTDHDGLYSHLLAYQIFDLFAPRLTGLLHPHVSLDQISPDGSTQSPSVPEAAQQLGARYVIFGSYQKQNGTDLRVQIGLYDHQKNRFLSPQVTFTTPLDDSLMNLLEKRMEQALKIFHIHLKGSSSTDFPALAAYRYYTRGMDYLRRYDRQTLLLAKAWLEKGLRENNHHFDDAALSLARSQYMLALIKKMQRENFTEEMARARQALEYVTPRISTPNSQITARYLNGHNLYLKAATFLAHGHFSEALTHAVNGLSFVPEDAMLENIVAQAATALKKIPPVPLKQPECF